MRPFFFFFLPRRRKTPDSFFLPHQQRSMNTFAHTAQRAFLALAGRHSATRHCRRRWRSDSPVVVRSPGPLRLDVARSRRSAGDFKRGKRCDARTAAAWIGVVPCRWRRRRAPFISRFGIPGVGWWFASGHACSWKTTTRAGQVYQHRRACRQTPPTHARTDARARCGTPLQKTIRAVFAQRTVVERCFHALKNYLSGSTVQNPVVLTAALPLNAEWTTSINTMSGGFVRLRHRTGSATNRRRWRTATSARQDQPQSRPHNVVQPPEYLAILQTQPEKNVITIATRESALRQRLSLIHI